MIDPFPRPSKTANSQPQPTSKKITTDLNNCDSEYVQKPISPVLSLKPHETIESMQSSNQMTNEAMKENVIRELLETEENYVKLLSSLCIGYVPNPIQSNPIDSFLVRIRTQNTTAIYNHICYYPIQCVPMQSNSILNVLKIIKFITLFFPQIHRYLKELRKHYTIFPTESLILIFSNIEKIFRFQQKFVERLRIGIEHNKVADTFLEFVSEHVWICLFLTFFIVFRKSKQTV